MEKHLHSRWLLPSDIWQNSNHTSTINTLTEQYLLSAYFVSGTMLRRFTDYVNQCLQEFVEAGTITISILGMRKLRHKGV